MPCSVHVFRRTGSKRKHFLLCKPNWSRNEWTLLCWIYLMKYIEFRLSAFSSRYLNREIKDNEIEQRQRSGPLFFTISTTTTSFVRRQLTGNERILLNRIKASGDALSLIVRNWGIQICNRGSTWNVPILSQCKQIEMAPEDSSCLSVETLRCCDSQI